MYTKSNNRQKKAKLNEMLGWGDHREFDLQNIFNQVSWERLRPVHSDRSGGIWDWSPVIPRLLVNQIPNKHIINITKQRYGKMHSMIYNLYTHIPYIYICMYICVCIHKCYICVCICIYIYIMYRSMIYPMFIPKFIHHFLVKLPHFPNVALVRSCSSSRCKW